MTKSPRGTAALLLASACALSNACGGTRAEKQRPAEAPALETVAVESRSVATPLEVDGSVTAKTVTTSATLPLVIQIFVPSRT